MSNTRPIPETMMGAAKQSPLTQFRDLIRTRIASGAISLPVLPKIAQQVLAMVDDPNADVAKLSVLIHQDISLAGHVLRIANSAAYGGRTEIVSLKQAVTRLGMKLLVEIAISISLKQEVFSTAGHEKAVQMVWRHALATAAYGKEVARMKRRNVEGQFLCGLLHNVGKPVIINAVADLEKTTGVTLLDDSLIILMDELHGEIGEKMADSWSLPEQVRVASTWYQKYDEAPSFTEETMMTWLSSRLGKWVVSDEPESVEELITDPAFSKLNFYQDDIQAILDKKETVLTTVNAMDI